MKGGCRRFLFEIDWKKCRNWLKKNTWIFETESSCFCIFVKSYKEFKDAKELLNNCNDLYLAVIRKWDTYYLLRDFELSEKIKQFVAVSYSKDVEKIFEFANYLQSGITVNSTKDVVKLLGATSSSVSHYAMTLLNDPPTTKKGLRRVYLNRVQTGIELCNAYGCTQFKNFLTATVSDFLQLKTLYMEGIIYDKVDDLPSVYDKAKLSRHSMYLSRITTEIPYDRILNLYCYLRDKENRMWSSTSDLLMFLYSYYGGVEDGVTG